MKFRSVLLPLSLLTLTPLLIVFAALVVWQWGASDASSSAGYAGLGERAEGFAQARPGNTLAFPEDHGPHPDYRIEWWYLTANLEAEDGRPFGVQWTLFRQALAPARALEQTGDHGTYWDSRQLWMAHAALSTPDGHRFAEKFARGMRMTDRLPDTRGQAGVNAAPFAAWIDDWSLAADAGADGFERLTVGAAGEDFGYRLRLTAQGPLVPHGNDGFSQKSADGQGSMYYSQPFFDVSGEVSVAGESIEVSGRAWLDREWSSQLLGPAQHGWDWFSLHLDSGDKLMAFRLRGGGEGNRGDYFSGSWITAAGELTPLDGEAMRLTPLERSEMAGRELPIAWHIEVPERGLDSEIRARHPKQWMATSFPYWEGMVTVAGSHAGEGYLEMTGY